MCRGGAGAFISSILRVPSVIAATHTPRMTRRLKAAEPTIVEGPRSPAMNLPVVISMTLSRISGAEEPRAIRDKLATTGFLYREGGGGGSDVQTWLGSLTLGISRR
jgi:hypothetical protein